jgi:pimeloyl-ACP methyl ester carboxylesterase
MDGEQSPIDGQSGRAPLARDSQQWMFDYLVQETGRVMHFQGEGRGPLPRSVHSHAMISKHVGRQAARMEQLAKAEDLADHPESAAGFYFNAAELYAKAQHPVLANNGEKRYLYDGLTRCWDRVRELAPYEMISIDIPFEGSFVTGDLHLNPAVEGPAPLVFHIPGCDVTKESWPNPYFNQAHHRGMHAFSFDGPGVGASNLRGLKLTADNYERAASAALDVLLARTEIDAENVLVYATSFGSFWGMRLAATDSRVTAIAAPQASITEKWIQTDLESPRWKQLLAFITGAASEQELDATLAAMTMNGYLERVACPTLLTVGEYDPRAPLEELYPLFDQIKAPAELWVIEDGHHWFSIGGGAGWVRASHGVCLDWLRDRAQGKPMAHPGEVVWVGGPGGPNAPDVTLKRTWYGTAK